MNAQVQKTHWTFFWSGNWPLLDVAMGSDRAHKKEFYRLTGTRQNILLCFSRNGVVTLYHAQEEYDRLEKYFLEKFKSDPTFLERSARGYRQRVNADLRELKKIYRRGPYRTFSNKELAHIFLKARTHFTYNATIDHYDWYMEKFFTPELQRYLETRLAELGKIHLLAEYTNTLITPHRVSIIFKERQELFSIIRSVKRNKNIARPSPALVRRINDYVKHYDWMPVLVNNPPNTAKSIWRKIVQFIKTNAPLRVKAKRLGDDYDPRVLRTSIRYLSELHPPSHIRHLILGLRAMAFLRTEDYVVMSQSSYFVRPLYIEIAKRLGLTYYQLKEFLPEEIVRSLESRKKVPRSLLRDRLRLSCYVVYQGKRFLCTGKQAKRYEHLVEHHVQRGKRGVAVFQGTPAYPGKVKGRVRLAWNPTMAQKIRRGEILVGRSMSAGFVPALRKADGILAEFGGLTSHPVIVAREFQIPCVIGLEGITSVLNNGDRVEVDAEVGIVRKISVRD